MKTPVNQLRVPDLVLITRTALKQIEEEARQPRSQQPNLENETGGVLFGRRISLEDGQSAMLIIEATGPGPNAFFHHVEFNPDVEYANKELDRFRHDYPACDYIGTWHKHPSAYRRYSMGDVKTAYQIFADESYKLDEIINPIVWVNGDTFTIQYYYMNRDMAQQGREFMSMHISKIKELEDNNPLVQAERIAQPTQPYPPRIVKEGEALRSESYNIEIHQHENDFIFTVTDPDHPVRRVYLVIGPDYPQTPPQVVVEDNGQQIPTDADKLVQQWNPDRYLVDLANRAFRPAQKQPDRTTLPAYTEPQPPITHPRATPSPPTPPSQPNSTPILWSLIGILTVLLFSAIGYIAWDWSNDNTQLSTNGVPTPIIPASGTSASQAYPDSNVGQASQPTQEGPSVAASDKKYQELWSTYDNALEAAQKVSSKDNWDAVFTALDDINSFVNPSNLDSLKAAEPRTEKREKLRIEARHEYAKALVKAKEYSAAVVQFDEVINSPTYSGEELELAKIRLEYAAALQQNNQGDAAAAQCEEDGKIHL